MANAAAEPVRWLVWLNRPLDARALFWHAAAPAARTLLIEEFGPRHCSLRFDLPARLTLQTGLPPSSHFLDDEAGGDGFARALNALLQGAIGLRVLAAGSIDHGGRWQALLEAVRPGIVCLPRSAPIPEGYVPAIPVPVMLAGVAQVVARPSSLPVWREAASRAYPAAHCVADLGAADLLVCAGLAAPTWEDGRIVRRSRPEPRCVLLLPGLSGSGDARCGLELAGPAPPGLRLRVDGIEAAQHAEPGTGWMSATLRGLANASCHVLELLRDDDAPFALARVRLERLA